MTGVRFCARMKKKSKPGIPVKMTVLDNADKRPWDDLRELADRVPGTSWHGELLRLLRHEVEG